MERDESGSERPEGVEQFYAPRAWRISLYVGEHVFAREVAHQGHHLARAAARLLELYSGTGDASWGMLDPGNTDPIRVDVEPIEE